MNWFDIFSIILLLRTGYIGFKNGLSAEVYKAAGMGLSGLAAFYFYKKLVLSINQYTVVSMADAQMEAISFALILLLGLLICKFVFMFIQKIMQLSFAKNFNTTAGMIFGLSRGAIVVCLVFMILNWSAVDYIKKSIQEKSFSGQYIAKVNSVAKNVLVRILPEEK